MVRILNLWNVVCSSNASSRSVEVSETKQYLEVYLHKDYSDSTDFSIRFNVAVMKMRPKLTYKHSRTCNESCDGVFRETPSSNIL